MAYETSYGDRLKMNMCVKNEKNVKNKKIIAHTLMRLRGGGQAIF